MDAYLEEAIAWLSWLKARREATEACLERKEPSRKEMANVAAHPEDSNGATREGTIGATEDRSRDRRLAVGRRGRPKKRTQGNGGPRQMLAAIRGRFTTLPFLHYARNVAVGDLTRYPATGSEGEAGDRATPRKQGGIQWSPQVYPQTGCREASSRIFHRAAESDDIVEESTPTQTEEESTSGFHASAVRAPATPGSSLTVNGWNGDTPIGYSGWATLHIWAY
jgi:hypothetical protein